MFKDLLPIGTVITLKGGLRKLMITGIKITTKDDPETIYDYIGVLYPEGFLGEEGNFIFNHSDVNDVIFRGYSNPEREDFISYLDNTYDDVGKSKEKSLATEK